MKTKTKTLQGMPKGLSFEAKRLWNDTIKLWEVDDPTALVNLRNACFSLMRLRQAEAIVKREGMISTNRFGVQVKHPAMLIVKDETQSMRASLEALHLDLESLHGED